MGGSTGCIGGMGLFLLLVGCGAGGDEPVAPKADVARQSNVATTSATQTGGGGYWDGRPTLGGVWIAHPSVEKPQRVRIQNSENGKTASGALFRTAENGSDDYVLSSDAAIALGIGEGQTSAITLTPLDRDQPAPSPAPQETPPEQQIAQSPAPSAPGTIGYRPMVAGAGASLAGSSTSHAESGDILQIATYGIEENALGAAQRLRSAGVRATVTPGGGRNNPLWTVAAGPVGSAAEKDALAAKVKAAGFADAYFVSQ